MRLDRLELKNFRRFGSLELTLNPSFTLLVGVNGSGKTSLLDALAIALGRLLHDMHVLKPARYLKSNEVRFVRYRQGGSLFEEAQWPVSVAVQGVIGAIALDLRQLLSNPSTSLRLWGSVQEWIGSPDLKVLVASVQAGQDVRLPVLAHYPIRQGWLGFESQTPERGVGSRLDGYVDCLESMAPQRELADWLYKQTLIELQEQTTVTSKAAVETAICQCIEGLSRFYFDIRQQGIFVQWQDGRVESFSTLSDGYRNLVAIVADIAWRAVTLNPSYEARAAELVEGVVLIDEIDQHLHPAWQRKVVGDLRRTFPKIQFVATTHSPQVVASVKKDEVRLLGQDSAGNPVILDAGFVEGRDSNSLLEDLFGVPERPLEAQERLHQLALLIDEERFAEAAKLQGELEAVLGPDDPEMIRARWRLDLEAALGED